MAREVTKAQLKELIQNALDEGLETKEIAEKFNEEYGDENAKLTAADITKLKELVGLKGAKPKKKRLQVFKIVDDVPTETVEEPSEEQYINSVPEEALPFGSNEEIEEPETEYQQF